MWQREFGNFGTRYTRERTQMIPLRDKYMVYLTIWWLIFSNDEILKPVMVSLIHFRVIGHLKLSEIYIFFPHKLRPHKPKVGPPEPIQPLASEKNVTSWNLWLPGNGTNRLSVLLKNRITVVSSRARRSGCETGRTTVCIQNGYTVDCVQITFPTKTGNNAPSRTYCSTDRHRDIDVK